MIETIGRFVFGELFVQKVQFNGLIQLGGYVTAVFLPLLDTFRQQILDLTVYRTEIVLCPGGDGVVQFGREPQRHLLLLICHGLIQGAGVDDGLGILVAAEDNQKIGDHCGLPLLVQIHSALFAEALQSHLHHANSAVHD